MTVRVGESPVLGRTAVDLRRAVMAVHGQRPERCVMRLLINALNEAHYAGTASCQICITRRCLVVPLGACGYAGGTFARRLRRFHVRAVYVYNGMLLLFRDKARPQRLLSYMP